MTHLLPTLLVSLALQQGQADGGPRTVRVQVMLCDGPAPTSVQVQRSQPRQGCMWGSAMGAALKRPDADGWVTFENVEGNVEVTAFHPTLGEVSGRASALDNSPLVLRFQPGASLSGTVVDARGRPVTEATVEASSSAQGERSTRVNRDGTFEFANLKPGSWLVKASAEDGMWWAHVSVDIPAVDGPCRNTSGPEAQRVELTLPAAQWFSGRVVDSQGKPVPSPRVHLQNESGSYRKSFSGDAQGRFETFVSMTIPMKVWAHDPREPLVERPARAIVSGKPVVLRLEAR
jgi:Carboxypeptidase regulatory-like domain